MTLAAATDVLVAGHTADLEVVPRNAGRDPIAVDTWSSGQDTQWRIRQANDIVAIAAALGSGALPACVGAFIVPCGSDGTEGDRFDWNATEIATEISGTGSFDAFDLQFEERPRVPVSDTYRRDALSFQLLLVECDGARNVGFLDDIRWGFVGVPAPSALLVARLSLWCAPRRFADRTS